MLCNASCLHALWFLLQTEEGLAFIRVVQLMQIDNAAVMRLAIYQLYFVSDKALSTQPMRSYLLCRAHVRGVAGYD